nr:helix-turn-helix domain-containing protein [uncultured Allomuricauda sp.]
MELNQTLLFFFSALGAFNGLCLGIYFLGFAKPKHIANRFLGLLLLMMSVRIGKSVFFYFKPDLSFIYLQIGLSACFFIGPFLYFYIKSIVQPQNNIRNYWKYHILALFPIIIIVGYLYPFETNIELWRPYIIHGIYLQWFFYIMASAWVLREKLGKLVDQPRKLNTQEIWILSILFGNLAIWAAYFFTNYTYYIVGALTFSFLFYILMILVFLNKKKSVNLFVPNQKYADKRINNTQADILIKRLNHFMKEDEPFKDANIKSSDLAKKLQISVHQLSQLLNDNMGKSFPLYINEHRIEKAQQLIASHTNITLETIGYECGFNSKSTFYTTFKKLTGTTPAKFKEKLQGSYL